MRKLTLLCLGIVIIALVACDAPSPSTYKGEWQRKNSSDMNANTVGGITLTSNPTIVSATDQRAAITATVISPVGFGLSGVDVTFKTDTGFFRSEEHGPTDILTVKTDSYGIAIAQIVNAARTFTVSAEAGDMKVYLVILVQ